MSTQLQHEIDRGSDESDGEVEVRIIDCDVHVAPPDFDEIAAYLPEFWRREHWDRFRAGPPIFALPLPAGVFRHDSTPPAGGIPASDPRFTAQQLLVEAGVDLAVLWPLVVRHGSNIDDEIAVCSATNRWLAESWLDRLNGHRRYYGTIAVAAGDPEAAVREIETYGGDPRFVQVGIDPVGNVPMLGDRRYDPIFRAAERHGLPIALHFITSPGMSMLTPVGFPAYTLEFAAFWPVTHLSHITSMICEGTFDRFPGLRVINLESGISWAAGMMWRLERLAQKGLLGALERSPREYLLEHVRFASQPLEEPRRREDMWEILALSGLDSCLMFATDYPHWDFDHPSEIIGRLPEHLRERIMRENAREAYRLPSRRPDVDPLI